MVDHRRRSPADRIIAGLIPRSIAKRRQLPAGSSAGTHVPPQMRRSRAGPPRGCRRGPGTAAEGAGRRVHYAPPRAGRPPRRRDWRNRAAGGPTTPSSLRSDWHAGRSPSRRRCAATPATARTPGCRPAVPAKAGADHLPPEPGEERRPPGRDVLPVGSARGDRTGGGTGSDRRETQTQRPRPRQRHRRSGRPADVVTDQAKQYRRQAPPALVDRPTVAFVHDMVARRRWGRSPMAGSPATLRPFPSGVNPQAPRADSGEGSNELARTPVIKVQVMGGPDLSSAPRGLDPRTRQVSFLLRYCPHVSCSCAVVKRHSEPASPTISPCTDNWVKAASRTAPATQVTGDGVLELSSSPRDRTCPGPGRSRSCTAEPACQSRHRTSPSAD